MDSYGVGGFGGVHYSFFLRLGVGVGVGVVDVVFKVSFY